MVISFNLNPVLSHNNEQIVSQSPVEKLSVSFSDLNVNRHKTIQAKVLTAPSLVDFKNNVSTLEKDIELALYLNRDEEGKTEEMLDHLVPQLIDQILREGSMQTYTIDEPLDLSEPITPFLLKESYVKKSPKLEIAVVGANILSRGSSVVSLGILLNKIQEAIIAKKNLLEIFINEDEKTSLKQEIDILTKWHEYHSNFIFSIVKG